jgi:hypothetical protein
VLHCDCRKATAYFRSATISLSSCRTSGRPRSNPRSVIRRRQCLVISRSAGVDSRSFEVGIYGYGNVDVSGRSRLSPRADGQTADKGPRQVA